MAEEYHRLFVGGLYEGVSEAHLHQRFASFGSISSVEIKVRKDEDGAIVKTFAHVGLKTTADKIKKCIQTYNNTKWKGSLLQLQQAKESFVERLKREREETAAEKRVLDEIAQMPMEAGSTPHDELRQIHIKGAIPGTQIEGKKNWVVGKYGRVLPVVHLRSKDKKKVVKVDPSKFSHTVKKLNPGEDNTQDTTSVEALTWQLEEKDTETLRKRRGQFGTPNGNPVKQTHKKYNSDSSDSDSSDDNKKYSKPKKSLNGNVVAKAQELFRNKDKAAVKSKEYEKDSSSSDTESKGVLPLPAKTVQSKKIRLLNKKSAHECSSSESESESKIVKRHAKRPNLSAKATVPKKSVLQHKTSAHKSSSSESESASEIVQPQAKRPASSGTAFVSKKSGIKHKGSTHESSSSDSESELVKSQAKLFSPRAKTFDGKHQEDKHLNISDSSDSGCNDDLPVKRNSLATVPSPLLTDKVCSLGSLGFNISISKKQKPPQQTQESTEKCRNNSQKLAKLNKKTAKPSQSSSSDSDSESDVDTVEQSRPPPPKKAKAKVPEKVKSVANNYVDLGFNIITNTKTNVGKKVARDVEEGSTDTRIRSESLDLLTSSISANVPVDRLAPKSFDVSESESEDDTVAVQFKSGSVAENHISECTTRETNKKETCMKEKVKVIREEHKCINELKTTEKQQDKMSGNKTESPKAVKKKEIKKKKKQGRLNETIPKTADTKNDNEGYASDCSTNTDEIISVARRSASVSKAASICTTVPTGFHQQGLSAFDEYSSGFNDKWQNIKSYGQRRWEEERYDVFDLLDKGQIARIDMLAREQTQQAARLQMKDSVITNKDTQYSSSTLPLQTQNASSKRSYHSSSSDSETESVTSPKKGKHDLETLSIVKEKASNIRDSGTLPSKKRSQNQKTLDHKKNANYSSSSNSSDSDSDTGQTSNVTAEITKSVESEPKESSSSDLQSDVESEVSPVKQVESSSESDTSDDDEDNNGETDDSDDQDRLGTKVTLGKKQIDRNNDKKTDVMKVNKKLEMQSSSSDESGEDEVANGVEESSKSDGSSSESSSNYSDSSAKYSETKSVQNKQTLDHISPPGQREDPVAEKVSLPVQEIKKVLKKKDKQPETEHVSKQEKHAADNLKRLESLKERQRELKSQKNILQNALKAVDSDVQGNKKIRFDSESEDDIPRMEKPILEDGSSSEEDETTTVKKPGSSGLFDDADSDSERETQKDEDMFRIRPEYEGKKGKKLIQLQSRFGNDERFKLDPRFLDSDSEEEENVSEEVKQTLSEKDKSLSILGSIVGTAAAKPRRGGQFKDINLLKYDPTQENAAQFEVQQPEKPAKKKKSKQDVAAQEEETLPEVSHDRFFQVEGNLKEAFQKDDKPFSFASMFGGDEEVIKVTEPQFQETPMEITVEKKLEVDSHGFNYDTSDDEEVEARQSVSMKSEEPKPDVVTVANTFFFIDNDPRIAEGIEKFRRQVDMETLREKFAEERPELVDAYRLKRKRALRQKKATKHLGRKR